MIHWLWLLPAVVVGIWIGATLPRQFERGFVTGILATIAALFMID
ncbi:hypothetical protein [Marivita sp.]